MAADTRALRDAANKAAAAGKFKKAVEYYLELERADPSDASWPKRTAEMYRRLGKDREGIEAYERCVARYAEAGFLAQAIATCKLILQLDPTHSQAAAAMADMGEKLRGHNSARMVTNAPIDLGIGGDAGVSANEKAAASVRPEPLLASPPTQPAPAAGVPLLSLELPPPTRVARDSGFDIAIDTAHEDDVDVVELDDDAVELVDDDVSISDDQEFSFAVGSNSAEVAVDHAPTPEPEDDLELQATDIFSSFQASPRAGNVSLPPPDSGVPLSVFRMAQGQFDEPAPIDVDLADLPQVKPDVAIDTDPEPGDSLLEMAIDLLRRVGAFAAATPEDLRAFAGAIEFLSLPEGERIELANHRQRLFVITDGALEIAEGALGLDLRNAGDYFGENGALVGCQDASVATALADCELIAIERHALTRLMAARDDVARALTEETRQRRTSRLLAHHELFAPFSADDKASLLACFEARQLTVGEVVVEQGAAAKTLVILLTGAAQMLVGGARHGDLGPGDILGATGILPGEMSLATEVIAGTSWALALSDRAFRELMMTHPHVLEVVGNVADRRHRSI